MSRSPGYTQNRWYALQATLVLIFAGTLLAAAGLSSSLRRWNEVELGPPTTSGALSVRFPSNWAVVARRSADSAILAAAEAPGDPASRLVEVFLDLTPAESPEDALVRSGDVEPGVDYARRPSRATLLGSPLTLLVREDASGAGVFGAALAPGGGAVTIRVQGPPGRAEALVRLVERIAQTVEVHRVPSP
jgi:hypothetical protein